MTMLKPEVSLPIALATGGLVFSIYQKLPDVTDVRVSDPLDGDVDQDEKMARWTCAALVSGISLLAKDPNIFIVGGIAIIAMSWWTRAANAHDPRTGSIVGALGLGLGEPSQVADMDTQEVM
jgi:hypothetical protein